MPQEEETNLLAPEETPAWKDESLVAFVPKINPFAWCLINIILFVWSLLVLIGLLLPQLEDIPDHPTVHFIKHLYQSERAYLVFDCVSTAVWLLQIGLTVWHQHETVNHTTWFQKAELIVAVYFFLDSAQVLAATKPWKGSIPDDPFTFRGQFLSAAVNVVAYLSVSIETSQWTWIQWIESKRTTTTSNNDTESREGYSAVPNSNVA